MATRITPVDWTHLFPAHFRSKLPVKKKTIFSSKEPPLNFRGTFGGSSGRETRNAHSRFLRQIRTQVASGNS